VLSTVNPERLGSTSYAVLAVRRVIHWRRSPAMRKAKLVQRDPVEEGKENSLSARRRRVPEFALNRAPLERHSLAGPHIGARLVSWSLHRA